MDISSIFLNSLFSVIPQIIMIVICFRYYRLAKSKNATYFLLGTIFSFIKILLAPYQYILLTEWNIDPFDTGLISGILNLTGLTGAFFFAFAFRSLIKKLLTGPSPTKDDVINEIGQS